LILHTGILIFDMDELEAKTLLYDLMSHRFWDKDILRIVSNDSFNI